MKFLQKRTFWLFRDKYPGKGWIITILLFSLLLIAPAMIWGAGGGDLQCQSLRMTNFSRQFWQGDIYPRWLIDMYMGNGSPIMFFYPPLAYWVGAFFRPLAGWDAFGFYPLAASAFVAILISGITFFIWLKEEVGAQAALPATLLYMVFPFHVGYSFYLILILGTVWAYAWAPLLLYCAGKIAQDKRGGIAGFAITLCLLTLSNIPATIIIGPASVLYGWIIAEKESRRHMVIRIAVATLLGFGLSAFYLYPALAYRPFANLDLLLSGPMEDYYRRFVIPGFANANQTFYFLVWLSLLIFSGLFFALAKTHRRFRTGCLFMTCIALALMLDWARPLWERFEILQALQHPARLFIVPAICIPALAAVAFSRHRIVLWLLIGASLIFTILAAHNTRVSAEHMQQETPEVWENYVLQIDQYPFFLPSRSLIPRYFTTAGLEQVKEHTKPAEIIDGDATVEVRDWKSRHIRLSVNVKGFATVRVRQHYFPGFVATIEGIPLDIAQDRTTGQIVFLVPPGRSEVHLDLKARSPEIIGRLISIMALLGILVIFIHPLSRRFGR